MKASAGTRLAYVGAALVVLLGIVAIASRGHSTPAASGTHARAASQTLFDVVFTLWLLGMVAMACFIVYLHVLRRPQVTGQGVRWKRMWMGLGALAGLAVVVAVSTRFLHHGQVRRPRPPSLTAAQAQLQALKNRTSKPHQPSFEWQLAAGIVALVIGAALTAIVRVHRRRNVILEEVRLEEELRQVLDETLDDLRNEADPRKAVIAAYARMERSLAAHGLPRRPSEAPLEYLTRVLLELRVSEPAVRGLTSLFERAKFSPHDIDLGMKERAIDALVSLRNDLRAVGKSRDSPELTLEQVPRPVG
jgi:hypothetical protein